MLPPVVQALPEYAVDLEPRRKLERRDADSFPAKLRMQLQQHQSLQQSLHPSLLQVRHRLQQLADQLSTLLVLKM